jgi:hypothetical protein
MASVFETLIIGSFVPARARAKSFISCGNRGRGRERVAVCAGILNITAVFQ